MTTSPQRASAIRGNRNPSSATLCSLRPGKRHPFRGHPPSMARQESLHWTADPRFSYLRNPPSWHHRQTTFYLKAPSARMDKHSASERHSQWQWQGSDRARDGFSPMLAESFCMPCGVYSRTWSRLRAALGGYDAQSVRHKKRSCTFDCSSCILCCPCEYRCGLAERSS